MDDELQQYGKDNISLSTAVSDLKFKLKAADVEIATERAKWKEIARLIKIFKVELNDCVSSIQMPKELKVLLFKNFVYLSARRKLGSYFTNSVSGKKLKCKLIKTLNLSLSTIDIEIIWSVAWHL